MTDLDDLLKIADDEQVAVPQNLEQDVGLLVNAINLTTELKHDSATHGYTALYRVAGIAAMVCLVVGLGLGFALREPQPKETYDNPEMAYAQLESTINLLAQTLNNGMNYVHKFDPMIEAVNYMTGKQQISNNKKHEQ